MGRRKVTADAVLQALGDATRRSIVEKLSRRPLSVTELAGPLGVTLTAIGQHLQVLDEAGLVESQKVGRVRSCGLASEGFAVLAKWLERHRPAWDSKLDRLGEMLANDE